MKIIPKAVLLLISITILALAGCSNMTDTTGDIGIDLSAVMSKSVDTNVETVKVWLVAGNSANFVDLEQSEFDLSSSSTITLSNLVIGQNYTAYLSLGTGSGDTFQAVQSANGPILLGSAEDSATLTAEGLKTVNPSLTNKNIRGVIHSGGVTYAIDEGNLYYGSNTKAAGAGWTFNDLDLGINGDIFISTDADNGEAIVRFDIDSSALDSSYSTALPGTEGISAPIDLLSSEIFYTETGVADDNNDFQVIISQLDAGFVINILDEDVVTPENEWTPIDLSEMLSAAEGEAPSLSLTGELIKGLAMVEKGTDSVWIYLSTKVGNFRKAVSWADDAVVSEDFGDDFITESEELGDRQILAIDYVKRGAIDYLFVGTDNGLYSTTVPDAVGDFPIANETLIAATEGRRVEIIAAGSSYTACATALELVIVQGATAATIAFNEGLPVDGLLNGDDGITGLEWKDGDTLIISGAKGLVELEAAGLTYE